MVKLGFTYEDRVTKCKGIAIGHVTYISGCNQVLLQPQAGKDGKRPEAEWFDEQRLARTNAREKQIVLNNVATPGHDKAAPKR